MTVIDTVMSFYDMMNDDEKRELILRIGEKALADGLVKEADVAKATGKASGKKRGRKPFWIKSCDAIDDKKKGVFAVEGDWVNKIRDDLPLGGLCIVGTRSKRYALARRDDSMSMNMKIDEGVYETFDHLHMIAEADKFGDLMPEIKKQLA